MDDMMNRSLVPLLCCFASWLMHVVCTVDRDPGVSSLGYSRTTAGEAGRTSWDAPWRKDVATNAFHVAY